MILKQTSLCKRYTNAINAQYLPFKATKMNTRMRLQLVQLRNMFGANQRKATACAVQEPTTPFLPPYLYKVKLALLAQLLFQHLGDGFA